MPHSNVSSLPYRLLFVDLDGTLVGTTDVPSPRTVAAIRAAEEAGCIVVVSTGRNRYAVDPITAHWRSVEHYGIYCNGAVVCDLTTNRVLHKLAIDSDIIRKAAAIAYAHGLSPLCYGAHVEEDGGEAIYTDRVCAVHPGYDGWYGYRLRYSEVPLTDPGIAEQLAPVDMGVYGEADAVLAMATAWREAFGTAVNHYDTAERRIGPNGWCAFINHPESDKRHGAEWVAQQLGVPREQTMAIGDQLNDRELLRWAGLGVCMGDGHPELQACAHQVTAPFAEDGAAVAIERFLLGKSSTL